MDKKSSADIVREATERLRASWDADWENRDMAFNDLRFLASDQWPADIRNQRIQQGRPCLTINRLPQFVNQIANNVRANPPSLKAIPAGGQATKDLAKLYSGLFRQIQYRSNATVIFSEAEFYAVACGIGHFRIVTSYVDDNAFDQEILIKKIPFPLSVFWDPAAVEVTRKDADWCLVSDLIPRQDFKSRFPNASEASFDYPSTQSVENGLFWANRDAIRVAEYWVKRYQKKRIVRTATGETIDITELDKAEVAKIDVIAERGVDSYKIEQYLVSGSEVLDGPNEWPGRHIPIFPVIGSEVALDTKIIRKGLVRDAKDSQQAYNYWRSAAVEHIALAPRSPFLVTSNMIAKQKAQWDTHNTINRPYLLYTHDTDVPGGPRREQPPATPEALLGETNIASDEMKATTGVYDAALGARSNEISGIAIKARESQGDNATIHYQDNLIATLNHLGCALIDLAPKIYDADRTIALMSDNDEASTVRINIPVIGPGGKIVRINDMSVGEYQIAVKMGPSYATQRQEAVSSLIELLQTVPQAAGVIGDIVVENMDFPGAEEAARRLKAMLPPQVGATPPSPQQEQEQQAQQQFQQAMQGATLQEAQGKAAKVHAEAARTAVEAQVMAHQPPEAPSQSLAAGNTPQISPEEQRGQSLKNTLLEYMILKTQGQAIDANLLAHGRTLDNARKEAQLNQPQTVPIP